MLSWIVTSLLRWRVWHGPCNRRVCRKQKQTTGELTPTTAALAAKPTAWAADRSFRPHVGNSLPFQSFSHNHKWEPGDHGAISELSTSGKTLWGYMARFG